MTKRLIAIMAFLIPAFMLAQYAATENTSFEDESPKPIIISAGNVGETLDSGSIEFFYPDTTNRVDSLGLIPYPGHANTLISEGVLDLDSIGLHWFRLWFWGSESDTVTWGNWTHTYSGEPWRGNIVNSDTILFLSSIDSSIIIGVTTTITPVGGGAIEANGKSNASGLFLFGGKNGLHDVRAHKQGWTFDDVTGISISGNQTDTIFGTAFLIVDPSLGFVQVFTFYITPGGDTIQPSTIRYQYVDATGTAYDDTVRLTLATGVVIEKGQLTEKINPAQSDSSMFSFPLVSNFDVFVQGVQDSSSWVQFEMFGKRKTIVLVQIPKPGPFNPYAP